MLLQPMIFLEADCVSYDDTPVTFFNVMVWKPLACRATIPAWMEPIAFRH